MLVAVYGTLKRTKGNHHRLGGHAFVCEDTVSGYRLKHAGFPVAVPDPDGKIAVEIFDIENDLETLQSLDWLEGYNGPGQRNFYDRLVVKTSSGTDVSIYVGCGWGHERPDCPIVDGEYRWE